MSEWHPIETAPKDGTCVLLLSREYTDPADGSGPYNHPAKCAIGRWHAEGDSWCDEMGRFPDDPNVDDDSITLRVTGVWYSGGGWFQPNEVTHWMPLPLPPDNGGETRERAGHTLACKTAPVTGTGRPLGTPKEQTLDSDPKNTGE